MPVLRRMREGWNSKLSVKKLVLFRFSFMLKRHKKCLMHDVLVFLLDRSLLRLEICTLLKSVTNSRMLFEQESFRIIEQILRALMNTENDKKSIDFGLDTRSTVNNFHNLYNKCKLRGKRSEEQQHTVSIDSPLYCKQ
jgi:hypothetical protein